MKLVNEKEVPLVKRDKESENPENSFNTHNLQEGAQEEPGFGYVLEEINEKQTSFVKFLTLMFEIGILLIPVQIIIYNDVKPYEINIILYLQNYFNVRNMTNFKYYFYKLILSFSSINFLSSLNVFIYFFADTLVAYKVCLILGSCTYITYALKLIIHDSRPFWIHPNIVGFRCKTSFGCPTLDVFLGMFYFHFLFFNLSKRQLSSNLGPKEMYLLVFTKYMSFVFIGVTLIVGIIHIIFGENFIYQIVFSIFYVYLFLRVIIVFDEPLTRYAEKSQKKEKTSRMVAIYIFFTVIVLSVLSLIIYSITSYDLQIPLEWSENIAIDCPKDLVNDEISTRKTLLESCSIFNVMGASFGIYLVLSKLQENNHWNQTSYPNRLIKGTIGFTCSFLLIYFPSLFMLKSLATQYILSSIFFFASGIICYGLLPIVFHSLGVNNTDQLPSKKEENAEVVQIK